MISTTTRPTNPATINLLPRPDEHHITLGTNGSGKTTFERWLIRGIQTRMRVLILDTKNDDALLLPGAVVVESVTALPGVAAEHTIVYRPIGRELRDRDVLDSALQWSYEQGDRYTHINELTHVARGIQPGEGLLNLLSRGRARNRNGRVIHSPVGMESQRPRGVPTWCYTECKRVFMFFLSDYKDRLRVAEFTDPAFKENPEEQYGFRAHISGDPHSPYEFGPLGVKGTTRD